MTPSEFKAWFEGFTEAFEIPTKAQWSRIKERVGEIDGKPITERVFIDRWYPYWQGWITYNAPVIPVSPYCGMSSNLTDGHSTVCSSFDSCVAMNAVGRAEGALLSAAR
jgi:hypothetical protein